MQAKCHEAKRARSSLLAADFVLVNETVSRKMRRENILKKTILFVKLKLREGKPPHAKQQHKTSSELF